MWKQRWVNVYVFVFLYMEEERGVFVCVCRDGYVCLCAHVETGLYLEESHECAIEEEMWGVEGETGLYGGVFL